MKKESLSIAFLPTLLLLLSIVYYLCLLLAMPSSLLFVCCIVAGLGLSIFLFSSTLATDVKPDTNKLSLFAAYAITVVIVVAVSSNILSQVSAFGHWDAWWFWNYRAKFLSDPELWKATVAMKANDSDLVGELMGHPDYPPGVSSAIAFFWRLCPGYSMSVPFMMALCFGLAIPLLLFTEWYKRNLLISSVVVLYFFAFNPFYAWHVSYMIGDVWISFFLLGTLISWDYFKQAGRPNALIINGLMMGGLLWSKNEGMVLVLMFLLFQAKDLFIGRNLRFLLTGLTIPLLMFLVFKIGYAPQGDLFGADHAMLTEKLFSIERYKLIGRLFANEVDLHFAGIKWLCALYVLYLLVTRQLPARHLLFIIVAMATYTIVYILSPHDLEWHVLTSMDRLVWHFVPALVYILLSELPLERLQEWQLRSMQWMKSKI